MRDKVVAKVYNSFNRLLDPSISGQLTNSNRGFSFASSSMLVAVLIVTKKKKKASFSEAQSKRVG